MPVTKIWPLDPQQDPYLYSDLMRWVVAEINTDPNLLIIRWVSTRRDCLRTTPS
jgi:hypothetical protein